MVTPADLCFEYVPRWQEILPLLDDPSRRHELAALLEEKDRQLEDFIAANVCGGGNPASFGYRTVLTPVQSIVPGGLVRLKWQPYSSGAQHKHLNTANVSLDTPEYVTVPDGRWFYTSIVQVYPATLPTTGHVHMHGAYQDMWGFQPYDAFLADNDDEVTLHLTEAVNVYGGTGDDLSIEILNETDVTIRVSSGHFEGFRVHTGDTTN